MASSPAPDEVLDLVHQGWEHLRLQRPIAAWASWQRALRVAPGDPRATQALDVLAQADELPAAARAAYRFRSPRSEAQRDTWNEVFHGRDLQDLSVAETAFTKLADTDPTDSAARYNQALCHAWQGANEAAIVALDLVVRREAAAHSGDAVNAWTLAEMLRQGAGAEHVADELNHTLTIAWTAEDRDPTTLAPPGMIRRLPGPTQGAGGDAIPEAVVVYEWLDRPMPTASAPHSAGDLPRVLATVIRHKSELRISSPNAWSMRAVESAIRAAHVNAQRAVISKGSTPLPIRLMDASVWTFRLPADLEESARRALAREVVEQYFENEWIHIPRHALGDSDENLDSRRSAFDAARYAAAGDSVSRAKLEAVVRVREQFARRPRSAPLYDGYPFDRVRRRLGLEPADPSAIDRDDVSCMSLAELGALDPENLAEPALVDAFRSARALAPDHPVVARFAQRLIARFPDTIGAIDPHTLAATLIRTAWTHGDFPAAFKWLERAVAADASTNDGRYRRELDELRAELEQLTSDPEHASAHMIAYWSSQDEPARGALEAAETLGSDGRPEHARRLAAWAEAEAVRANDLALAERARASRTQERREAKP